MCNSSRQDWLIDRSGAMLEGVDGEAPCIRDLVPAFGEDGLAPTGLEAATDDHPYPYLRSLPTLDVAIAVMAILTAKVVFAQRLGATGVSTTAVAGAAGTGVAV